MRIQATLKVSDEATADQVDAIITALKEVGESDEVVTCRVGKIRPQTVEYVD